MKKIEAFIRHEALEAIHDRLAHMGLPSMSVTEVKGSGRQKGFTESYRGAKTTIFLRPKLKLEMVLDDGDLDRAVDCILELAHTGEPGDGIASRLARSRDQNDGGPRLLEAGEETQGRASSPPAVKAGIAVSTRPVPARGGRAGPSLGGQRVADRGVRSQAPPENRHP